MIRRIFTTTFGLALSACTTLPNAQLIRSPLSKVDTVLRGSRPPGEPLIVLIHGLGSDMGTWKPLIGLLSAQHQVFAYDRPGYGNSGWTNRKRDVRNIAEELRMTLVSAGLPPPYLIVGHSLGGSYAEAFASLYANDTAGMLMIDPTVRRQQRLLEKHGIMQAVLVGTVMLAGSPMPRREFFALNDNDAELKSLAPYDRGPVTILMATHGDSLSPGGYVRARQSAMSEMAAQHRAKLVPVDSGHFIHREASEEVVAAILQLLAKYRP
jgi:pimeloyl-ACP methyl ester carboxylesterase